MSADIALTVISGLYSIPLVLSEASSTRVLQNVAMRLFQNSSPVNDSKPGTLGEFAVNRTIELSGLDNDEPNLGTDAIAADPLLHSVGEMERRYLDLLQLVTEV